MNNYKMLFQTIDLLEEGENHHVARKVGRFIVSIDKSDRFEEVDQAIAMCQDIFVHNAPHAFPVDAQAREVVHMLYGERKLTEGHRERLAYDIAQVISHARQQYRQYLPHVVSKVY